MMRKISIEKFMYSSVTIIKVQVASIYASYEVN